MPRMEEKGIHWYFCMLLDQMVLRLNVSVILSYIC